MKILVSLWYWTIGFFFFSFCFVVILISILTLSREKTGEITRLLFQIQLWLIGIKLVVKGHHHISKNQAYLIMGNHQSLFDIFVVPAGIPLCFVGIQAAHHFSYPLFGYLIQKWGNIPIDRNNLKSAMDSLEQAKKTIKKGMSICIMPEGHRTMTGRLEPFKKGPFHLAKAARADILPFGINGLYQYNRKGAFIINPGKVTVTFGKPILYDTIQTYSVEQLRDKVFDQISQLSQQIE
ncbi:MAG: lysophospholipid acyltransferase family protein [Pseudomonadota bacterium]